MNLFHLATWIAIPLLGLGSVVVFAMFLVNLIRHRK